MPADDPKTPEPKSTVDLTDPAQTQELTDDELKKVTGGFQRSTLTTSSLTTAQFSDLTASTVYGGGAVLGLNAETAFGGFSVNPTDKLKR